MPLTIYLIPEDLHDVVIANPPFGVVPDRSGHTKQFEFGKFKTKQIDQAIALNALQAMKDDGKAVLILGGKLGMDESKRSDSYNTTQSRGFYWELYQNYNVTRHISIDGDLYKKQGAGFPIDLIVIEGKGKSSLPLPAAQVPPIYSSFEELGELIDEHLLQKSQRMVASEGGESVGGINSPERVYIEREPLLGTAENQGTVSDPQMVRRNARNESAQTNRADAEAGSESTGFSVLESTEIASNSRGSDFLMRGVERYSGGRQLYAQASDRSPGSDFSSTSDHRAIGQGKSIDTVPGGGHPTESGGMATGDAQDSQVRLEIPKQVHQILRC